MKDSIDYLLEWLKSHGPDEWHRVADNFNWDLDDDFRVLNWIVNQSKCDKATILHIFWGASPEWFLKYKNRSEVNKNESHSVLNFDLLTIILKNWKAGLYKTEKFHVEPVTKEYLIEYRKMEAKIGPANLPWSVPEDMRRSIKGEKLDNDDYMEGYAPELVEIMEADGVSP